MFDLKECAQYISLEEVPASWLRCRDRLLSSYDPLWLECFDFDVFLSYYGFEEAFRRRFFEELSLLRTDDRLNFICHILYFLMFRAEKQDCEDIWRWPSTPALFSPHGSFMLPVVALLCGTPLHVENMAGHGFDSCQVELHKKNVRLACTEDRRRYGIDGIRLSQMLWGAEFMRGRLIQCGRLQYEILEEVPSRLRDAAPGNCAYISIHIPAGDSLSPADVDASLESARACIPAFFPALSGMDLVFFTCTWLLGPQLESLLSPDSNIRRFRSLFRIIDVQECTRDFLGFAFDMPFYPCDYVSLPERTSLQRGLKALLLEGCSLSRGIGILSR